MKALLCGLFFLTTCAAVWAQTPMPQGSMNIMPVPGMPLTYGQPQPFGQPMAQSPAMRTQAQPQAPVVQTPAAPAAAPTTCSTCTDCCQPCKTCVREPAIRKITHVCYSKTCEEFCLPKCHCPLLGCICGGCIGCDGPHAKYYLVKKVRIEECPTTKCVPAVSTGCGGGCVAPTCR